MTTLQIKNCDIPSYLHQGNFYRSLHIDDPEGIIIKVPVDCFHQDGKTAADFEEFRQLLRVMEFWMLDEIPVGVLHYCNTHSVGEWEQTIADLPDALKQTVQPLLLSVYSKSEIIPLEEIIKTDRWDLIMHAVSHTAKSTLVTVAAAQCGNLRLLQYLYEHGYAWDENTCAAAGKEGHLDCLQYAHENGCPWDVEVFKGAARNGHLKCIQYAHQQGLEWHTDVCMHVAFNGRLDCLKFAHENGCPWDSETTVVAAEEGHLDCLQYALEHDCPADEWACGMACRGGHLECLQFLHQSGVPWRAYSAFCAAQSPTIDCLQYLRDHGCPWDGDVPDEAAREGNMEFLRFALERGCPHNDKIVENTTHGNNLNCLQYVVEDQGLYMDKEVFKVALLIGDLANLQYLLDQGCPILDAEFGDCVEKQDYYEYIFGIDNPEFVLCVGLAVERGWVPCDNFIQFVVTKDKVCRDWLIQEGFYTI